MAIKSGIVFITLLVGCLAIPKPESDISQFYQHVDPESRIVGGTAAADGSHPHMAAMSSGTLVRSFLCGASVLSQRTVLTAAHCIAAVYSFGSLTSSLRVTVGTNRWNQGGQSYSLSGNATHQHYVAATIKNDVGLLFTSSNIAYNERVRPIPLNFQEIGAGVVSRAAGWGRIAQNGALSVQLLELQLNTISGAQCVTDVAQAAISLNVRAPDIEPHIELCVVHPNGAGFGTCNGDSGSALVHVDQGSQIGVVSWGFPCARGAPDMFARVSAYESWFTQHIRN